MGMGNCIGDRENALKDSEDEFPNDEILLFLRNMDEEVDEQSKKPVLKQSEECEPTREPVLKQVEKWQPTRKSSLKQTEKPVTRFFKKVAVFCCDNSRARSVQFELPPAPCKCGEETDSTASFDQLEP